MVEWEDHGEAWDIWVTWDLGEAWEDHMDIWDHGEIQT